MEHNHVVRHIKSNFLRTNSNLPNLVREQLLRKIERKENTSDLLNFEKLIEGDNKEWEFLLQLYKRRLWGYSYTITQRPEFGDDIVQNAICDALVSKKMFNSADHLVGHLFHFVRIESLRWMNRGPGRFILDEDFAIKVDSYLIARNRVTEETTLEERIELDNWRDDMITAIKDHAEWLPSKWSAMLMVYFKYYDMGLVRREMRIRWSKNDHYNFVKACLPKFAEMINFKLQQTGEGRKRQVEDFEIMIKGLSNIARLIIKHLISNKTHAEIAKETNRDSRTVTNIIVGIKKKLLKVWPDPQLEVKGAGRGFGVGIGNFFSKLADSDLKRIVEENIVNTDVAKVKTGGATGAQKAFSKEQVRDIVLMRTQQKMGWERIGKIVHSDQATIKKIVADYAKIDPSVLPFVDNFGSVTITKLDIKQVVQIRQLYNEGNYTQPQLASKYGISRSTIQSIVNGRTWKNAV